jgi:hypothetical protein
MELRSYIVTDLDNQYIIFGRDPQYFLLTKENIKLINFENNTISLVNAY